MLTRDDADVLCVLLDAISADYWHNVKAVVQDREIEPSAVVAAWRKLEKLAGMNGTVPDVGDFD